MRAYLLSVALLAIANCRDKAAPPTRADAGPVAPLTALTDVPANDVLNVEWSRCAGIRKGPVCEVGTKRTLAIWLEGPDRGWQVVSKREGMPANSDQKIAPKIETNIDGGTRLTIDVPVGARKIEMKSPGGRTEWSLVIGEVRAHDDIDRLVALGRTGEYADALASLEALRARAPVEDQGPANAAIARMALALGNVDRAEPAFRASIAAAKADGRIADVVKDAAGLLWALVHLRQRYVDARALLEEMTPFGEQYPEGHVWLDYHAGLLASDTADVRTALEKYRAAERGARRLGLDNMQESSADEVARVLTRIGGAEEAVKIAQELPISTDPCTRATRALNIGEALMERTAHRQLRGRDPEVTTGLATARTATAACPDPHRRLLALVYAAEYAMEIHDDQGAQQLVEELEAAPPDRGVLRASRRADVLGRWLLHQGNAAAALASFENVIQPARAAGLLEETFRGEVGAGRSLLALGRRRRAVARLKKAQELLEQMLRGIPIEEGRGSFLGGHDDGVRYLVSALVEGGAAREALRAARWARSIELAHAARLDRLARLSRDARHRWDEALSRYQRIRTEVEHQAENDWTVPHAELARLRAERQTRAEQARAALDDAYRLLAEDTGSNGFELSDPAVGELYLMFFPGPDGWFAFAATAKSVMVRRIEDGAFSSAAGAEKALALFGPQLAGARRVRLFPYGVADRVDWQAVLWRSRPLISSLEVEYALDVGKRAVKPIAIDAMPSALVVSNPKSDLQAATPEADGVVRALIGWKVTRLEGPAATRAATLEGLSKAQLFHYAGHAQLLDPEGLSSALLLRGDSRVELGDLLAAPSVPELVFLSACEAAGNADHQASLMGLAQAFIAAGSGAAIAPSRPIGDQDARGFVAAFYPAFVQSFDAKAGTADRTEGMDRVRAAFRSAALEVSSRRISPLDVPGNDHQSNDGGGMGGKSFRLLVP